MHTVVIGLIMSIELIQYWLVVSCITPRLVCWFGKEIVKAATHREQIRVGTCLNQQQSAEQKRETITCDDARMNTFQLSCHQNFSKLS